MKYRTNDHACSNLGRSSGVLRSVLVLLMIGLISHPVFADWPGLLGVHRDGKADASCQLPEKLADSLEPLWSVPVGQGYAGPAIAGNQLAFYERQGNTDRVRLLNAATGEEIWSRDIPAKYQGGVDADKGPRCVPTITASGILVYSAAGELTLLDRQQGTIRWTRSLKQEFQSEDGYFGAGSSPLVVDDRAIINVGGKRASVVCVSLPDGKDVWTACQGDASYASPIYLDSKKVPSLSSSLVVVPTRTTTFGLDMQSGKELWKFSFGQRGPTVNAATPIVTQDGLLFMTASYGIGSQLLRVDSASAKVVRKGEELSSQYATPISVRGYLFGCDGREDQGGAVYRCWNEQSGKLRWERAGMPICHTIGVEDRVLVFGIDGTLWCLDANASGFAPLWQSTLPQGVYRAVPALSDNLLFVRSSNGADSVLSCFELK